MTFANIVWSPARMAMRVFAPCIIAIVLMLLPLVAHAGTITVNGTTCTLPEAITAANIDAAIDGCTAGSGDDTLLLGGLTHSLATGPYNHYGMNATPSVTTTIVISGGVGGAIVERSGVDKYRLFHVADTGNLTLLKITVRNGDTDGVGGAILNLGKLDLLDSALIANTARSGGGLSNDGTVTFTNSDIISNTANDGGGGISNNGTATLTNANILSNTAGISGGGFKNSFGIATVKNSAFISNMAGNYGGGISNNGTVTLTNAHILSNTAAYGGGFSSFGTATLTNANIRSNTAAYGGGIYSFGTATVTNSDIISNTAAYGGGFYSSGYGSTAITITNATIRANIAITSGGAIYKEGRSSNADSGSATIIGSRFIGNHAGITGSTIQQLGGTTTIDQSCIMNNSDNAVNYVEGNPIDAANNWWGAADGPSGAGPGVGDSVSAGVIFAPVLTTAPEDCVVSVALAKQVSTAGNLLPGQPLTYTLTITNDGVLAFKNLYVTDALPADFALLATNTTGPAISANGSSFVITDLLPSQVATITLTGQVTATLDHDTVLTNNATLTSSGLGTMTATVSNNILVPRVAWAQEAYETDASNSTFTATVTVSPTNPYITTTVQVVITDSATANVAATVQEVTFPPGSGSQSVVVPVASEGMDVPRTIQLGLQSPLGASLGDGSRTNAALTVTVEGHIFLPHVQR